MSGFTAGDVAAIVAGAHARMATLEQELNAADAVLGDGDTGSMLARVLQGMADAPLDPTAEVGATFGLLAKATVAATGSSLGTLIATALMTMARATKGKLDVPWSDLSGMLRQASDAMLARGGASLGDKTVLDALEAAVAASAGRDTAADVGEAMRTGARTALAEFRDRPCRIGRARMFPEKSMGRDDPGMLAFARLVGASDD